MFKMIDTDGSGQITFEELKVGLKRFGANLNDSEIYDLMQAVRSNQIIKFIHENKKDHLYVQTPNPFSKFFIQYAYGFPLSCSMCNALIRMKA